jgi:hypothetical protein
MPSFYRFSRMPWSKYSSTICQNTKAMGKQVCHAGAIQDSGVSSFLA